MALASAEYASTFSPQSRVASATQAEPETSYWTLSQCKQAYLDYLGSKTEEIQEQQDARRYRHGSHWTSKQVEILNKRKQPVVTYNRLGRKIDSIVGLVDRFKQDPKAFGKTQRDEPAAELATFAVRTVVEGELKQHKLPFITEQAATDGIGGVEMMLVKGDRGDIDISFAPVLNDDFFYDPTSIISDFSDAAFMGVGKWMTLESAQQKFPDFADMLDSSVQYGSDLTSNPDRERKWFDSVGGKKRVRVVDIWYKHGPGWCWALFTGAFKMMEGRSYFNDPKGQEICKYRMFSAFVDQDGDRYGFPRNLKSPQDEINQRRSKGLHELAARRIKAEEGAFNDIEEARREAVKPDGVVIYNKDFEMEFDDATRLQNMDGNLKFLEEAKNEIENFGPNPALIGQGLEYKSGRAISLLQQAGIAELGPFIINHRNWKLDLYRCIWCAIQRYWTGERYIRVTDDEGIAQFVAINKLEADPATGLPKLVNAIARLDVNIVMDEGPDEVNMMADAYDTLGSMATQGANVPPQILIELAPLQASVKRKLLAMLQPKPEEEQKKQQAELLQFQALMADIKETLSKVLLNQAKAQEIVQGGAHGMLEREFDRRAALEDKSTGLEVDQEKHAMKMAEMGRKDVSSIHQAHAKNVTESHKTEQERQKHQMKLELEDKKAQTKSKVTVSE